MGQIKGRADDMLIIRGVNLFHTQVEDVFKDYEELAPNYQLVVTKEGLMDCVEVRVETSEAFQKECRLPSDYELNESFSHEKLTFLTKKLQKNIKDSVGLSMKLSLKPYGKIPKSEGGKMQRIIDLRNT